MDLDPKAHRSKVLVQVRDLRMYFPSRIGPFKRRGPPVRAVDGVSLDMTHQETLGLVGESGCGKTTLGRSILRLIEPTAGSVHFNGVDLLTASVAAMRRLRRDMQIVFQDPFGSLDPRMTVGRIIAEPLVVHRAGARRQRDERVARLLEQVGLRPSDASRYPHEFSGGQRQRIGIARAIALTPRFIVCDEPVSALDVSTAAQILNLLGDLKRQLGLTYLFIAHDLAVVKHFCDRVAVMYLGRIAEIGDAADLYAKPGHPYTIELLAAAPDPDPARRVRVWDRLSSRSYERVSRALPDDRAGEVQPVEPALLSVEPPDPASPPTGCTFHARCGFATAECRHETPALKQVPSRAAGHLVACHRVDAV